MTSPDDPKANGIIKKLQGEVKGLVGKIKVKNTVTVSQEKVLQETSEKLKNADKDLQSARQQLSSREEEVSKLKEQLEATVQKLNESREVLKTNENVINWLNRQLNEKQLHRSAASPERSEDPAASSSTAGLRAQFYPQSGKSAKCSVGGPDVSPAELRAAALASKQIGECAGLDSKYFERRDDSIQVYGLPSHLLHRAGMTTLEGKMKRTPAEFPEQTRPSAYFSA